LVDINSKRNELFNNEEVVFIDLNDLNDFGEKINFFSKNINKTKQIAKKGGEKGHSSYKEKIITNNFLELALN